MATRLDPNIWRAIAGPLVQIPTVNSRAYYFPQGHLEEASFRPKFFTFSSLLLATPYTLCTVSAVEFLADVTTDEVFANLILTPIAAEPDPVANPPICPNPSDNRDDEIVSFVKAFTTSDLNEFTLPGSCVNSIFPLFDENSNQQTRMLEFTDVHSRIWGFQHNYDGREEKHTLTTGWRRFVESKNLMVGDSVVFMKYSFTGKMFIGIRRAAAKRGKLYHASIKEAMELAVRNEMFGVLYYPNAGRSNFVVKAGVVDNELDRVWHAGMRVKMAVETEGVSAIKWFHGVICSIAINGLGPWQGTLWRILQIKWDEPEPEVLKNFQRVSPWLVELVTPELRTQEGAGNPHPVYEKYSDEKLVDRIYFQCQSKSSAESFYLRK